MQQSNCGAISAKLPQVVRSCRKHYSFRAHLFARIQWKTEFDPVALQRLHFQRFCLAVILLNLSSPRSLHVIGSDLSFVAFTIGLQPQKSQEAIRCECSNKQALLGLPVIDQLASHSSMHSARSAPEIIDHQVRPILAETIGENSFVRWAST